MKIKTLRKALKRLEKQYGNVDVLVEGPNVGGRPQPIGGIDAWYEWLAASPKVVIW